jgi:hypothetical protein
MRRPRQPESADRASRTGGPAADAFLWQMNTETLLWDRTERLLHVIDRAIEVVTHPRLRGGQAPQWDNSTSLPQPKR